MDSHVSVTKKIKLFNVTSDSYKNDTKQQTSLGAYLTDFTHLPL